MTDVRELEDLVYLIRCAVHKRKAELSRVQNMNLERLYHLSRFHSLAALTYTAVESAWDGNPPQDFLPAGWKEARDAAVRNALLFGAERKALESFCEEKGIWYLPLKGALLQNAYPGLGLREMADNDILFDANFQQEIHDWFVNRGYAVREFKGSVHDTYHKAPVLNFEMHTALFSSSVYPEWAEYFTGAAARLQPVAGTRWERRFTPEDGYLYMLAHMYKHFWGDSVGIRSLLDVYFFLEMHETEMDQNVLKKGLAQLDLYDFHCHISRLAKEAFGKGNPLSQEQLATLLRTLAAGAYGTERQRLKDQVYKYAGEKASLTRNVKLRYSVWRLFPDQAVLQKWCRTNAPFFGHHPKLIFLAYGYRLLHKLIHGRGKNFLREQEVLWKLS